MQKVFEKIIEAIRKNSLFMIKPDGYGEDCISEYTAIEIVKQEAEQYNNGWISCSERIPTDQERWFGHDLTDAEPREFIVMVKGACEPTTGYYHSKYGWIKDLTREYDENNTGYANEIVAWKFFPAPYQPEGE